MNKNQLKGSARKLSGKAGEVAGKTIGNKKMERQGKTKQYAGRAQKAVGDVQAKVKRGRS